MKSYLFDLVLILFLRVEVDSWEAFFPERLSSTLFLRRKHTKPPINKSTNPATALTEMALVVLAVRTWWLGIVLLKGGRRVLPSQSGLVVDGVVLLPECEVKTADRLVLD